MPEWMQSLVWLNGAPFDKYGHIDFECVLMLNDGSFVIVGEINKLGGVCDCCSDSPSPYMVARYAVLNTK